MAKLVANIAINMATWNLGNPFAGHLGEHDSHHFTICDAGNFTWDVGGYNFLYFCDTPVWGLAKSLTVTDADGGTVCISGASLSIPAFYAFAAFADTEALESYIFRDNDRMRGSEFNDTLRGFDGLDRIFGSGGNDTIEGGHGADRMRGGGGSNTFVYKCAEDSTGQACDRIANFNVHRDHFQFATAVTAVDPTIASGTLRSGHFNSDLGAAADAAHLGANHAVLFTPDLGQHAGETFLVVDLNGVAGYQGGDDVVIQLVGNIPGGISAANFEVG